MISIILVSQKQNQLEKIKGYLKDLKYADQEIKIMGTHPNYLLSTLRNDTKLLLIDTKTVNHLMFEYINQVRQTGFGGSIIIISEKTIKLENKDFLQAKNLFYLENSQVESQIKGLVNNCLNIEGLKQRKDQRFDVKEHATLEAYSSDFKTETTISNISKSGMKIAGELSGLHKGDLLRLHLQFDQINKERQLSAKVVWLNLVGDKNHEAGLEFVSQKDVYKFLLERAIA